MLVLTRGAGKRIAVFRDGDFAFWIEVLSVAAGQARIGLEAPDSYRFVREELLTEDEKRLTVQRKSEK